MPRFETTRIVSHSPRTMFNLVADVERYPEFVPMCERLVVRRRVTDEAGVTNLLADMSIGYKVIRETFASKVRLDSAANRIDVSYVDGPFKHLENRWTFFPADSLGSASREPVTTSLADPSTVGCRVHFFIDYEFKSRTFQLLAGAVFETVFRKMAEAFEARADALSRV